MEHDPTPNPSISEELRRRIEEDQRAGRTVALSSTEMDDPVVRRMLPELLEAQGTQQGDGTPGFKLTGYTILGEIGQGGMSTVYLARDERLHRNVALKKAHRSPDPRTKDRAMREARALARLSHPHIVTVHDIVETGSDIVIVMEWVDGISLAGLLRQLPEKPSPDDMDVIQEVLGVTDGPTELESTTTRTFVRMIRDVALATHCAHEAGLLHLDIKPSNVLVRADGCPLLADFGVVREIDVTNTHTRSFAGTPIYAAPEQLRRDDAAIGPQTDVYGLGMALYELLARTRPLSDEGLTSMLRKVEAGNIPRLSSLSSVARDLENIVHKAIATNPKHRYATAAELAADLTAFLDGLPVQACPERPIQRLQRWVRAEVWKAILIACLLILVPTLVGLGAYLIVEMPAIEAARHREAHDRASQIAQRRHFGFWEGGDPQDFIVRELRDVLELAPGNEPAVAVLLTSLGREFWSQGLAEIDRLPKELRDCQGVQAVRRRMTEQRPFLTDEEASELAASRHALDLLLVTLDRIGYHTDTELLEPLEVARDALSQLVLVQPENNHMARGLEATVAAMLHDEQTFRGACLSLETIWSGSESAMAWIIWAHHLWAPEQGLAKARELYADHPERLDVASMCVQILANEEQFDEALTVLEQQQPAPTSRKRLQQKKSRVILLGVLGERDRAAHLFDELKPSLTWSEQARLLQELDPAEARRIYVERLEQGDMAFETITDVAAFSSKREDLELAWLTCKEGMRRYPGLARFRTTAAGILGPRLEFERASELYASIPAGRNNWDDNYLRALCHCGAKRWDDLAALCRFWVDGPNDPPRSGYYLGIASSRRGAAASALEHLEAHIAGGPEGKKVRMGAYFEVCWLLADPASPARLRDPEAALSRLHTALSRSGGGRRLGRYPWYLEITAEVYGINDDTEKAREFARRAAAALDELDNAPPEAKFNRIISTATDPGDLRARIEATIERYREQ